MPRGQVSVSRPASRPERESSASSLASESNVSASASVSESNVSMSRLEAGTRHRLKDTANFQILRTSFIAVVGMGLELAREAYRARVEIYVL